MGGGIGGRRAQIALEFIVVYSFVLLIFVVFYALIITQRAATLTDQGYSSIQLVSQDVAGYIDQAVYAGSGYNVTIPLVGSVGVLPYNLSISSSGVVIASMSVGSQVTTAQAFSAGRNLVINGTLSPASVNGIGLYQVPTVTGSLTVYNYHNIIYIDEAPPYIGNVTGSVSLSPTWETTSARFAGTPSNSQISVPWSSSLGIMPENSGITMSIWIDPLSPASPASQTLIATQGGSGGCGYLMEVATQAELEISDSCGHTFAPSYNTLVGGQWYNIVATLTSSNSLGELATFYVNGVKAASAYTTAWQTPATWNNLFIGYSNSLNPFNGFIADAQIYNRTLGQTEVWGLYTEGINGAPINSTGLDGWWQLNNNTLDWSGNGNGGSSTNVIFNLTTQDGLQGYSVDSHPGPYNAIIGVAAVSGSFGSGGNSLAVRLNGTGSNSVFLVQPSPTLATNITATGFNGNITTENSLVGWWPLNEGYGNYIHDLSGGNHGGVANAITWAKFTNETNFEALDFPYSTTSTGVGIRTTDAFDQYYHGGNGGVVAPYWEIDNNDSITLVAWVYYQGYGSTGDNCQGIFDALDDGDLEEVGGIATLASTNSVWEPGYCTPVWAASVFESDYDNEYIGWPTSSGLTIPKNRWEMVTGQYDGGTGQLDAYVNTTLFSSRASQQSGPGPVNDIGPPGIAYIGNSSDSDIVSFMGDTNSNFIIGNIGQYGGAPMTTNGDFYGMMSDVQMYASFLTPAQLNTLYQQGPTGIPLQDSGLIGWWPLDGNLNDYSWAHNNGGFMTSSLPFVNTQYSNNAIQGLTSTLLFSHTAKSVVTIPNNGLLNPSHITLAFWMNASGTGMQSSGQTYYIVNKVSGCTAYAASLTSGSNPALTFTTAGNTVTYGYGGELNSTTFVAMTDNGVIMVEYVNGLRVASGKVSSGLTTSCTNNLEISDATSAFNGIISDVQIYNSVLTGTQIGQLYVAGRPPESNLVAP